jgi:hypothetical protein
LFGYITTGGKIKNLGLEGVSITGGDGSAYISGLVGDNYYGSISNCYSTGIATGDSNVGGFVGYSKSAPVLGGIFLDIAGPNNGYGWPHTDAQMKQQASYLGGRVGWDFVNTWAICENMNYPRLRWSIPAADFVCPDGVSFVDYAFFASRWLNTNCAANNNCDGTDFYSSGTVDLADLKIFCNYWLQGL